MSRNKSIGTTLETLFVRFMACVLGDERIERRALSGTKDRGDVSGLTLRGKRVVCEVKNHRRMELAAWLDEAEVERGNDDAEFAVVVHKRRGCGAKRAGQNYVTMTWETFAAIIAGAHELLEDWDG